MTCPKGWSEIPPEYTHRAMDRDGFWYAFKGRAIIYAGEWIGPMPMSLGRGFGMVDWKESLEERPAGDGDRMGEP